MNIRKKIGFVVIVYMVSFVVTVLLANYTLNYDRVHPSKNQDESALIRLNIKNNGIRINEMEAYRQPMDPSYMRTQVTPISESKKILIQMDEGETSVKKIEYVLTNEENEKEIESGVCTEIQRVEGERQAEIFIESNLGEDKEYCLNLTVEDDHGEKFYYYTRIAYGSNFQVYDKIQFVMNFHQATFSKTSTTQLAEYLYSSSSSEDDFRNVSIYSDSEIITWGDLNPSVVGDVDIFILNIDRRTAEIQLVYEIEADDEKGEIYNYIVKEYYDVSTDGSNVNLIGYSRTMEEKLNDQSFYFENGNLRLGLVKKEATDVKIYGKQEPEIEETTSEVTETTAIEEEYNTYIAFVADGSLWVHNMKDNILTQAFGFERNQGTERESSYLNHGVKILKTEDNGDLLFAVYGYMYSGDREGEFGIQINKYNRADGTYSEQMFIPYTKGYTLLDEGMNKMAFINKDDQMYFYVEDRIYRVDVVMKTIEEAYSDAASEDCVISENGKNLVLNQRNEDGKVEKIEWYDLQNGKSKEIHANGRRIEMVGFLGNNLVYTAAALENNQGQKDVIYIMDYHLNVLNEYRVEDGYIENVTINEDVLKIDRVKKDRSTLPADYIMYNNTEKQVNQVEKWNKEHMYETWISTDSYQNTTPVVMFARGVEVYHDTEVVFEPMAERYHGYYVSVDNEMIKCESFRDAYELAYRREGKLLNYQGRLIMRPSVRASSKSLNGPLMSAAGESSREQRETVLEWLIQLEKQNMEISLESSDMYDNLENTFLDYNIVDLTGISLEHALTMIDHGTPLIVKNSEGTWCVVEGYGAGHIEIADSKEGTVVRYERDSAIQGIQSSGNVIYGYFR